MKEFFTHTMRHNSNFSEFLQFYRPLQGRDRATDNIYIERLWRTTKPDYIYICLANNGTELYKRLKTFFDYYNNGKTHQGIGRCVPTSFCKKLLNLHHEIKRDLMKIGFEI